LTNEKEKKSESKGDKYAWLIDAIIKDAEGLDEDDKKVDELYGKIRQWEAKEEGQNDRNKLFRIQTHELFLATQAMILTETGVIRSLLYALAAKVFETPAIDPEAAKKEFDDHLAKRLRQLFGDKDDLGYID
jgi:hypothetical protein